MVKIILNYKSGRYTLLETGMKAKELEDKIRNKVVDINPVDLTMVRWDEVESISLDIGGKLNGKK